MFGFGKKEILCPFRKETTTRVTDWKTVAAYGTQATSFPCNGTEVEEFLPCIGEECMAYDCDKPKEKDRCRRCR